MKPETVSEAMRTMGAVALAWRLARRNSELSWDVCLRAAERYFARAHISEPYDGTDVEGIRHWVTRHVDVALHTPPGAPRPSNEAAADGRMAGLGEGGARFGTANNGEE